MVARFAVMVLDAEVMSPTGPAPMRACLEDQRFHIPFKQVRCGGEPDRARADHGDGKLVR